MTGIKYFLTLVLIISSPELFSQSVSPNELLGTWQFGYGKHYRKLIFINDKTLLVDTANNKSIKVIYSVDKIDNNNVLSWLLAHQDSIPSAIFKISRINHDQFILEWTFMKNRSFENKGWEYIGVPFVDTLYLKRMK